MNNNPIVVIREDMGRMEAEFKAALPSHIPVERFKRVALTAINTNPDLWDCDRRSLMAACTQCAQDGLLPDNREAALVSYNMKNKDKTWTKVARYMPMIGGIYKRARNSGDLSSIRAHVVYENDHFSYELGDQEKITHCPATGDRGSPVGAYAIAVMKDGTMEREYMPLMEIEQVREVSKMADSGPWKHWWGEMARKTVVRRLSKRLPTAAEVDQVIRRDDDMYELEPRPTEPAQPRPQRIDYQKQGEMIDAEAARMEAEFQGATTGQLPDTPEERGEEEEPSPSEKWREQMFAAMDDCATEEDLDALEKGAEPHYEAMDPPVVSRIKNRFAQRRLELKKAEGALV